MHEIMSIQGFQLQLARVFELIFTSVAASVSTQLQEINPLRDFRNWLQHAGFSEVFQRFSKIFQRSSEVLSEVDFPLRGSQSCCP